MSIVLNRVQESCLRIRDQWYPQEMWLSSVFNSLVVSMGGAGRVLLEVGCGRDAQTLRMLSSYFELALGADLEIARQGNGDARWRTMVSDAHCLPLPDRSVDAIALGNVIEHLADVRAALAEFARVLRPGGRVIIVTVNKWFAPVVLGRVLPHRLRQLVNRAVSGTNEEDTFPAFYRGNTPKALTAAAAAVGLITVDMRYMSHHPRYFMFSALAYRAAVAVERVVRKYERLAPLRHFILCQLERPSETEKRA